MSKPFVILHLSDAHIGNPKHQWDSFQVFESLLGDLKKVSSEFNLQPHLVIFSGDLAFGQLSSGSLKDQYDLAGQFLENVLNSFQNKPHVFLVPGNHDLNRDAIDDAHKEYRDKLDVGNIESMMINVNSTFRNFLTRQNEWQAFANKVLHDSFTLDPEFNATSGIIDFGNVKIGLAGLNSAWASQGDKEKGKLWIGKNQFERSLAKIKEAQFKIAVAHHPYSWLNEGEDNWMRDKLQSNFDIFFHGHDHSSWFEDHSNHLMVAGGACYERSDKAAGYSFLSIDFDNKKAQLFLREYTDRAAGGWKAHVIPSKTDENGMANIEHLFSDGTPVKHKQSPAAENGNRLGESADVSDFIEQLDRRFRFIWEPPSVASSEKTLIFWAIRLRTPTPIHAVQSFVAAGLQKMGCEIYLWLDDLGKADFNADTFFLKIDKWFSKAGGNSSLLNKRKISEFKEDSKNITHFWSLVQGWLGTNVTYNLDKVLEVSKLTEPGDISIEQFSNRRPRRLLTPSMVWTGLALLFNEKPDTTVVTLGGFDEKNLWKAWKECVKDHDSITGHLYTPILRDENEKPLHMDTVKIGWDSRGDVREAVSDGIKKKDWYKENQLIPWCFSLLSLLPREIVLQQPFPSSGTQHISSVEVLRKIDEKELADLLTDEFTHWIV